MHRSSLLRGGIYTLLIQGQVIPVQLAIAITLARTLGPKSYGLYGFAFAVISFIQVMPLNGLDNVLIRYGAQYLAIGALNKYRGLLRRVRAWTLYLLMATSGFVILMDHIPFVHDVGAFSPQILTCGVLLLIFLPINTYCTSTIRSFDEGVAGQLPGGVVRPWAFLALIIIVKQIEPGLLNPCNALLLQGMAALAAVVVSGVYLKRCLPVKASREIDELDVKEWRSAILPYALVGGLMLINQQADMIMVGLLGGGLQAGIYKVSAQAANLISLPLAASNIFLAQRVAAFHARNEISKLKALLQASVRVTAALAICAAVPMIYFGKEVLVSVFGHGYLSGYPVLVILIAAQVVNVAFGSVDLILTMTGRQRLAVRSAGIAAVLNIVLCVVLIPIWGVTGAAISAACSIVCWNGLMLLSVRRNIGINVTIIGR